jgi:hypothetical protein
MRIVRQPRVLAGLPSVLVHGEAEVLPRRRRGACDEAANCSRARDGDALWRNHLRLRDRLPPSEPGEECEAGLDVAHVQDRHNPTTIRQKTNTAIRIE